MTKRLAITVVAFFVCLSLNFIQNSSAESSGGEREKGRKGERKAVALTQLFSPSPLLPFPPSVLINGTRTIGTGGDYASVTAAIADIQANGLDGALTLELLPTYTSTGETFPLNFTNLTGISAVNTLTLRPQAGATNRVITGSNATAIVNLNNANFVTIDGRAGGAGMAKDLTIQNTNTAGATVRFINEASNNTIKHTIVKGVATSVSSGVVLFSTTTGANGNDNNTIDNCDIQDGATTPTNGILSQGTNTTSAHNNSNNTISNNNIFNFYASVANDSAGVRLEPGSTDWIVTGNSLFQTATRAAVTGSVRGIFVNNLSGGNFTVTNNFVGGSQANAGGTAWTTTGTGVVYRFVGITMRAATSSTNSVQGNTVRNIVWTSSSTNNALPGVWCGIFLQAGSVNVGTTSANTIGSGTGTDSIVVTTSGNLGATIGIGVSSGNTINVSNNIVGSITTNGTSTSINHSLFGILSTGFNNTFSNNTIGSTTTANSLNAATSATFGTVTGQQVAGIQVNNSATITNNTIANLNNNYVGTASVGQIRGIVSTAITGNVSTGNTIRNLTTTSANTGSGNDASVIGVSQVSAFATQNHTVNQNAIFALSNINLGAVKVTGIRFDGGTSNGTKVISRNLIYGLSAGGDAGVLAGLHTKGDVSVQNNMIRLGANVDGFSENNAINTGTKAYELTVIHDEDGKADVFFNSCYVGGSNVKDGTNNTRVIRTTKTIPNSGTWKNNIFVNDRSNGGAAGGKHYIAEVNGTELPMSDHNLFNGSGNGFRFGVLNGTDIPALQDWKGLGLDGPSAFIDPNFVAPNAAMPDLHLQQNNPAVGAGTSIPGIGVDFDGDSRAEPLLQRPTTIGADENQNFTPSGSFFPPDINYPKLSNGSTSNRTLTGFATIRDFNGVPIAGGSVPRIWYRRSLPTPTGWASNPGTLSSGNGMSGSWSFVIDYSLLGITPSVGETYEYYIVAQDIDGNVNSNPAGAIHPDVNTQTAPPPVPNNYQIVGGISGTKTSCTSGCDVNGFSNPDGAFAQVNNFALDGNLTYKMVGDSTETGAVALNSIAQNDFPGFDVTFEPNGSVTTTHSGNVANAMFRLDGVSKVKFIGTFNGVGRFLNIRNENTANPTIQIQNGQWIDLKNLNIEGANANAASAVVLINAGSTGNDRILIDDSIIRDLSNAPGVPANLVLSQGSATAPNTNITIKNSELFNFTRTAIRKVLNLLALIQGNKICPTATVSFNAAENELQAVCQSTPRTTNLTGIDFNGDGVIDGNDLQQINSTGDVKGIQLSNISFSEAVSIFGNRFIAIMEGLNTTTFIGICSSGAGSGAVNIHNNWIIILPNNASGQIRGIQNDGSGGGAFNVFYNTVLLNGTFTGSNSTAAVENGASSQTSGDFRNNIFFNFITGGTGSHNSINKLDNGSFVSNFNIHAGTGAGSVNNFFNLNGSQFDFATWRSITGGDSNSFAGNSIVDVTGYFADAVNGNLHVNTGTGYGVPPIGSNSGTPINGIPLLGVTTDIDGDMRSPTTPDIGADEYNVNRTLTTNGTLLPGNYDNITAGTGFNGGFGGGVTTTLGGIINVFGTMSVSCDSSLAGASPSNYVIGNLKKDFCATGLFDFPVGTNTGYSPVNVNITTLNTNPSSLSVKANNGTAVSNPPLNDATTLDRFWSLTETGALAANLLFNYLDADVDGNESNYRLIRIANGGTPFSMAGSIVNTTNNTLSLNNVTEFSDWTGGEFVPTGARATIEGRVVRRDGSGIGKATIVLQDSRGGQPHSVVTNQFGYFRFTDLPVGETYLLSVSTKQHQFVQPTQLVFVISDISGITFVALE